MVVERFVKGITGWVLNVSLLSMVSRATAKPTNSHRERTSQNPNDFFAQPGGLCRTRAHYDGERRGQSELLIHTVASAPAMSSRTTSRVAVACLARFRRSDGVNPCLMLPRSARPCVDCRLACCSTHVYGVGGVIDRGSQDSKVQHFEPGCPRASSPDEDVDLGQVLVGVEVLAQVEGLPLCGVRAFPSLEPTAIVPTGKT